MKKQLVSLLALSLVCGAAFAVPETKTVDAASYDYAEYISVENAPVIDGRIDDVWSDGVALNVNKDSGGASGVVTVLWNETGLYFLAEVEDPNVNGTDRISFWVAETYYEIRHDDVTYLDTEDAYFVIVESDNEYYHYTDADSFVDMTNKYTSATSITGYGYTVEVFVPVYWGETEFTKGHYIGFDVSIDNFVNEGAGREGYRYWGGYGSYWKNPTALGKIVLQDLYEDNGSPIVQPETPTTPPVDSDSSSSSSEDSTKTDSTETEQESGTDIGFPFGCGATVAFTPMMAALLAGIALMKKKK